MMYCRNKRSNTICRAWFDETSWLVTDVDGTLSEEKRVEEFGMDNERWLPDLNHRIMGL